MILIVDDTPENIFSLKRLLEINGFEVDSANSGEEALKKILKLDYSLIILDVQMPGMDGFEVAEAVGGFGKTKDIPIIFLTAINVEKKYITKGYSSGAVDYQTKPVDPDIFILKVKTLHNIYEQKRELVKMKESLSREVEVRIEAENELNKKMGELRSVLESIPQLAFGMGQDGEIEYVNQQWYLYSNSDKKLPQFHKADNGLKEELKIAMSSGKYFTREVRIKNLLTLEYRYHLLKVIPVKQENIIVKWVGTFNDIQEQKSANKVLKEKVKERTLELQEKNEQLEERNDELQQFVFIASHDLKEPLRKIQIFISHLESSLKLGLKDKTNHYLDRINNSANRMSNLIIDLLEYSRLSDSISVEEVMVEDIINEVILDLEILIKEKDANIIIDKLPKIMAIPSQIRQVVQNIIVNALKFTRDGVKPEIKIYSDFNEVAKQNESMIRIYFSDNGIGFDVKYLNKIFTIFQRLNLKNKFEGTGIGLAIAKKIMDKHKGTISANSTEGKGSTFIISFPR